MKVTDYSKFIDFQLKFNLNRNIRVLQITDMQPIDPSQQRYDGRLNDLPFNSDFPWEVRYNKEFYYIEKAIKDNNPDLIVITGDIVYGEFDDNGSNLLEFIKIMDSYQIPWAPVFGNHDNESKKGVKWQCEQFEKSKYCLFKRNNVTGNGNYNIGIFNNDELIRVIYMMDSNGTWHGKTYGYLENYPPYNLDERIEKYEGIYDDQKEYVYGTAKSIDEINGGAVKKSFCCHIAPNIVAKYAFLKGYQSSLDIRNDEYYSLGGDKLIGNKDFGEKGELYGGFNSFELYDKLKELSFDTMFVGHQHNDNISIDCDGLRVSFGIKTSTFDYHSKVGSLLFTFSKDKYTIEHKFIDEI